MEFTLGDTSIQAELPPWPSKIPPQRRFILDPSRAPPFDASDARLRAWGLVKTAGAGVVQTERLFSAAGKGEIFSLVPEPRSSVPLQWMHVGPSAIPDALADKPCAAFDTAALLAQLNHILGTTYSQEVSGLRDVLDHLLLTCKDFGEAYGYARGYWRSHASDFRPLVPLLSSHKANEDAMRKEAVACGYIDRANVHTRRVWDLYSNRVLPMHALSIYFHDVWTVSHSWVEESSRVEVLANVNGKEWPVPLPRGTSLEHIRVELLNLGAEYVWLDVVCLRQKGRSDDEALRKEEWKLDVPTAGYAYSHPYTPCITYFNGLGIPFDSSPETLASERHWRNRVWTMQEVTTNWLPGGLTATTTEETCTFFLTHNRLNPAVDLRAAPVKFLSEALADMRKRRCANPVDAVYILAYITRCETLPVYDEDATPQAAWTELLKHLPAKVRGNIFLRHLVLHPDDPALLPSWDQLFDDYAAEAPAWVLGLQLELHLASDAYRSAPGPGLFYQAVESLGSCVIVARGEKDAAGNEVLESECDTEGGALRFALYGAVHGTVLEGSSYVFLGIHSRIWLLVEEVGACEVEEAYLDVREFVMKRKEVPATEVVKRGVVVLRSPPESLPLGSEIRVLYRAA